MKLAVAGKGGAGKTTFSATAARLLARAGHPVLAIDADAASTPLLDFAPDSPVVAAIHDVCTALVPAPPLIGQVR